MANEDKKYFSENQAYFHSFGRAAAAKGQNFVYQATLKSGHNLDTFSIRSDKLPFIDSEYIIREDGNPLNGQSIFVNPSAVTRVVRQEYENIIKFYDGVPLTELAGSNHEAWQLIDNGNTVAGFVDPTDKRSADGTHTADGYEMQLLKSDGTTKIPAKSGQTWAFNAFNGTVLFMNGETPSDSDHSGWGNIKIRAFAYVGDVLEDRLQDIEEAIGNSSGDATSGINSVKNDVNYISGTLLSGFNETNTVSSVIAEVRANAALFSLSALGPSGDFAAQYQLMQTINNVTTPVTGSIINIPRDQFLSNAAFGYMDVDDGSGDNWSDEKDQTYQYPTLKLTFALDRDADTPDSQTDVYIPMHDLINDYAAANGVQYNEATNTFSVKIDVNSENFLTVGVDGIRLSGVQEAIDTAVSSLSGKATAGLETLSGAASGYLSGNAISNKFNEVDRNLSADEAEIDALQLVLSGYVGEKAVSGEFNKLETSVNSIHNNKNIVSSFVTTKTVSGVIDDNTLTVDVQISDIPGNAIVVKDSGTDTSPSGLWAQSYKAGSGIVFGQPDSNGVVPIDATYELPIASTTEVGGVKAGSFIDVDSSTGEVTVKKVENGLTLFNNNFTYDGSATKTLTVGDYISVDVNGNNDAITLDVVVNGEVVANNSGLIKGGQVYEVSSALVTAIENANGDLSGAISGAYTSGMIVIGDTDKIVASPIKLGTDRTFDTDADHAEFGAERNVAATEVSVMNFVNYGLNDLASAISGFNAEVEAIA